MRESHLTPSSVFFLSELTFRPLSFVLLVSRIRPRRSASRSSGDRSSERTCVPSVGPGSAGSRRRRSGRWSRAARGERQSQTERVTPLAEEERASQKEDPAWSIWQSSLIWNEACSFLQLRNGGGDKGLPAVFSRLGSAVQCVQSQASRRPCELLHVHA